MWYKFFYTLLWPIFHFLFPYKVIHRDKIIEAGKGYVVCSNHISFLDPVFIIYTHRRHRQIHFMAKHELFQKPLAARFLRMAHAFPVSRGAGAASGIKAAEAVIQNGQILGVFPEGTRSRTGALLKAKPGAAMVVSQFNTLVQPLAIVCKQQRIRPFRRVKIVVCDPIRLPEKSEEMTQREYLRVCTDAIMAPIAHVLAAYGAGETGGAA